MVPGGVDVPQWRSVLKWSTVVRHYRTLPVEPGRGLDPLDVTGTPENKGSLPVNEKLICGFYVIWHSPCVNRDHNLVLKS